MIPDINPILQLILVTLLPFLELRASIPYGILVLNMDWIAVFVICVITNILLAFLVYFFVNYVMHLFLRIKFVHKLYHKVVERTQKKIHPYVEKYGVIGLALFIGIPLPGSGVYSGGLGAYLLGFELKDYIVASIIGVLIAAVIVTIVSVTGSNFAIFIKSI